MPDISCRGARPYQDPPTLKVLDDSGTFNLDVILINRLNPNSERGVARTAALVHIGLGINRSCNGETIKPQPDVGSSEEDAWLHKKGSFASDIARKPAVVSDYLCGAI